LKKIKRDLSAYLRVQSFVTEFSILKRLKKPGRSAGIFSLIFVHLSSSLAYAVEPTANSNFQSGGFIPQNFYQSQPPGFNSSASQQLVTVLSSCLNVTLPIQSIASSMMMGSGGTPGSNMMSAVCSSMAGGISATTVCPGNDQSPMGSGGMGGGMGMGGMGMGGMGMGGMGMGGMGMGGGCPANPQIMQAQLDMAYCAAMCKYGKEQAKQQELKCITAEASNLSRAMGSLGSSFTSNIQGMQQQVQTIKTFEDDRTAQEADVELRLGGDPSNGSVGLIAQQANTQKLIANFKERGLALQTAQQQATAAKQVLDEQIQVRTMALTMNCFSKQPVPGQKCSQNGPPESPADYLKCRYRQQQSLGAGGVIERSAIVNAQGDSGLAGLDASLTGLAGDAPSIDDAIILTDPQALAAAANKTPVTVLSVADEMNRYGGQLSKFQIGGTDAGQFVAGALDYCHHRAEQTVNAEQGRTSSTEGGVRMQIRSLEQTNSATASQIINEGSQQYASNMASLTGQNIPPNTSACVNAAPPIQLGCVNNLGISLNHMLMGDTPESTMQGQIKGNNPNTYIPLKCQGLNGCISQMQNASRNIKVDQKNLANMRTRYILSANQATEKNARSVAQSLSPQIANLTSRLQQMGVNIPPIQGEELEKDQDGLVKPPKNALNYVGQYTSPPMPNLADNALAEAMSKSEEDQKAANQQLSMLQMHKNQLQNMMAQCAQNGNSETALTGSLTLAQQHANELAMANCGALGESKCRERHVELMSIMGTIQGDTQAHNTSIGNLQNGIDSICDKKTSATGQVPPGRSARMQCEIAYNKLKSSLNSASSSSKSNSNSSGSANFGYGGGMYGGGMYNNGMMPH
jgi:hypothetical protein